MSSLPDRSFVENRCDSPDEAIVERSRFYNNAVLLSFPDLVSCFSFNLVLPPRGVAFDWKRRDRIQLHGIGVFRFCLRQALPEGQNIRATFGLLKRINEHFGILEVLEPLLLKPRVELGHPQNVSLDHDLFAVDRHSGAKALSSKLTCNAVFNHTILADRGRIKLPIQVPHNDALRAAAFDHPATSPEGLAYSFNCWNPV
jgi:hypothetical protein